MAARIVINLDDIEARVKNLKRIDETLVKSGFITKAHLVKNWLRGRGGDEKSMRPLTSVYANKKATSGRSPIPNLLFSGAMQQSLSVKKLSKTKADVTFLTSLQRKKAEGNQEKRKNMMALSGRFITSITNFVLKQLQRK